ncbi:hypothetical protein OB959_01345 [Aeromonas bestiarum]|uniref:Phage protein n=1 Tax=Aeromonas bestiarum TaxID=105751 RepID=A0AAW7HTW8_9GAMM|nr:hypothetical protein [Aeromonas bestiarum]MDM5138445.1 hypothetical protein [Aeromonas bestiarum]
MSLLAAIAKGFGAGTVDNARAGLAEQQRQREAAQRRDDMGIELDARDKLAQKQIDASREENDTRFKAMAGENQKNRDHDWAMFEKRLALETQAAAANASVRARETHAKNIMGTMEQLTKRKAELMENDKITDEQRAVALGEIDALGYTLASDPGAQQLLGEFGGGGYANYWLSLNPNPEPNPNPDPKGQGTPDPTRVPPPKPKGLIQHIQGDRTLERQMFKSGEEALRANKNPSATAASAYQAMYK